MKVWFKVGLKLGLFAVIGLLGTACTAHVWVAEMRPDGGVIAYQNDGRSDFDGKFREAVHSICGEGSYKRVRDVTRTDGSEGGGRSSAAVPGVSYSYPVPKAWKETEVRCATPPARRPLALLALGGVYTQPDAERACSHKGAHLPTRGQLESARHALRDEESDVWTVEDQAGFGWSFDVQTGAAFLVDRDEERAAVCVKSAAN